MATFGDELRREREVRGIELREVAEATKVNLRFLEALERNDFAALPGGLFTRGFIRAYATHIGADPDRLLNAYLSQISGAEAAGGPYRPKAPEAAEAAAPRRGWGWIAGAAAVALVPAALLLLRPSPEGPAPRRPAVVAAKPAVESPAERRVEVVARAAVQVRALCGEEIRIDRAMDSGEQAAFLCAGRVLLDSSDAGAVEVLVDGQPLAPPGTAGEPLEAWEVPGS